MTELTLNLSPEGISKAYQIPAQDWEIANKRVSVLLDPGKEPQLQAKLKALPNYASLVLVAQRWKSSTFHHLVSFAQKLAEFANTDVQSYLQVLGMIVDKLEAGEQSMQSVLDDTVKGFITDSRSFATLANKLVPELKAFDDQMSQASISGGAGGSTWAAFSLNAGVAFDDLYGRFNIITDNLNNLQNTVDTRLSKQLPVVVSLVDLPLARQNWLTVALECKGFAANAPQQTRYLDGDW